MSGEIKIFKRELVGGFDRQDVIEYIEQQAREKQRIKQESEAAHGEIKELRQQVQELDEEVKNVKAQAINETEAALLELTEAYNAVKFDIDTITGNIKNELALVEAAIARLSGVVERTSAKLSDLHKSETE